MGIEARSRVPQEAVDKGRLLIGGANFGSLNGPHLFYMQEAIAKHFADKTNVVVIPYAAMNMDTKADDAQNAFVRMIPGLEGKIHSIHKKSGEDILKAAEEADGFFLVPGNAYLLSHMLHREEGLVDILRQKSADRIVIAGVSAGPLVMADTVSGAADPTLPVIEQNGERVVQVGGLGLLPPHVHPVVHHIDFDELFSQDEQQELFKSDRRFEVLFDHLHSVPGNINWHLRYFPNDTAYALPDDSYFVVDGMTMEHRGEKGKAGVIFEAGKSKQIVEPGTNLSHLLLPRSA